ncbi:adenosylmethionine--8-amino-7-oxononanoate transaminase [Chitinivorax sp. B]|uniref:adenosylmethionine--8-amino-7-oxononanoate transaminase n=1 Tax=Chitinivorax sp. B TaxID=2502235 RepID=UPI0010F5B0F1|nr:adenosylmethionine--8-amino-7-oxononanoate transaminase [Chitinivorax sp. B]
MTSNNDWLNRSKQAVWHPCTQMKRHETLPLVPIAKGEGAWLIDFDGNRYLDAVSSWWVNLFGHCNPRINDAIKQQLDTLEHVILAGFTQQPVVELSERLAELTGLGHAFYGSDGASATEIALKMSFHYWRNLGLTEKTGFISLKNSYHGETLGALSVTDVALFRDTYAPLLRQSHQVMSPDWRLAEPGESREDYAERCAQSLADYLEVHHAHTAALIVEPLVQGAAGMGMYHPVYLQRARELCDRYQVHLIADEIAVGFGRTGTMFAHEQAGIKPDFLCLSKGITGGYLPLSVVLTTDVVYQAFYHVDVTRGFLHSHSYTGNALACRAALAVLDIFRDEDVIESNRTRAAWFSALMEPIYRHPKAQYFRHTGMIWALDVVTERPDFANRCFQQAMAQGVLLRPMGKSLYFMPPYVVDGEEVSLFVSTTLSILDAE